MSIIDLNKFKLDKNLRLLGRSSDEGILVMRWSSYFKMRQTIKDNEIDYHNSSVSAYVP